MQGKRIFTVCDEHATCTQAFEFVTSSDASRIVPIPQRVRNALATCDFADDVCIGVEHIPGNLTIRGTST
jgi:hypothetical protein